MTKLKNPKLRTPKVDIKGLAAFTLVELLVVITVVGVLTAAIIGILNSQGLYRRGRDSQRLSDLQKVQGALERYFVDYSKYPTSPDWNNVNSALAALNPTYLTSFPQDPKETTPTTDPCRAGAQSYFYRTASNDKVYFLVTIMETEEAASKSLCSSAGICLSSPSRRTCYVAASSKGETLLTP